MDIETIKNRLSVVGDWRMLYVHEVGEMLDFALEHVEALRQENTDLHRLLDLRDEQYFKFCESGMIPTQVGKEENA